MRPLAAFAFAALLSTNVRAAEPLWVSFRDDGDFHSGVQLRCISAPADAKIPLHGYLIKIDPTPRAWTGGIFDDFATHVHWMFDLQDDARARNAFKLGEWAHMRVETIGPSLKVWVNGIPTCNLIDYTYTRGPIALKIHSLGDEPERETIAVYFKNIRIIADYPGHYTQPMDLSARTAPGWTAEEIAHRERVQGQK